MKKKEIDIQIIEQLVNSVPDDIDILSINLNINYSLELKKDYIEVKNNNQAESLAKLMQIIEDCKKQELLRNDNENAK